MPRNPPPGYTRIAPYLLYEDTSAAFEWLTKAFGFPRTGLGERVELGLGAMSRGARRSL